MRKLIKKIGAAIKSLRIHFEPLYMLGGVLRFPSVMTRRIFWFDLISYHKPYKQTYTFGIVICGMWLGIFFDYGYGIKPEELQ